LIHFENRRRQGEHVRERLLKLGVWTAASVRSIVLHLPLTLPIKAIECVSLSLSFRQTLDLHA